MFSPTTLLRPGSMTFFTGPMFCGKTLELIRHLQIFQEQQIPLICLRPAIDTRTSTLESRSGLKLDGQIVDPEDLNTIKELIRDKWVIGVDELNFFTPELVPILVDELRRGKTILLSGIDTNFRAELFPTTQAILAIPETIVQRSRSVCSICHQHNATRTQRLRNGKPVPKEDPMVLVEGSAENVTYEARCLEHHELG